MSAVMKLILNDRMNLPIQITLNIKKNNNREKKKITNHINME
jgi:hypothetical protein